MAWGPVVSGQEAEHRARHVRKNSPATPYTLLCYLRHKRAGIQQASISSTVLQGGWMGLLDGKLGMAAEVKRHCLSKFAMPCAICKLTCDHSTNGPVPIPTELLLCASLANVAASDWLEEIGFDLHIRHWPSMKQHGTAWTIGLTECEATHRGQDTISVECVVQRVLQQAPTDITSPALHWNI